MDIPCSDLVLSGFIYFMCMSCFPTPMKKIKLLCEAELLPRPARAWRESPGARRRTFCRPSLLLLCPYEMKTSLCYYVKPSHIMAPPVRPLFVDWIKNGANSIAPDSRGLVKGHFPVVHYAPAFNGTGEGVDRGRHLAEGGREEQLGLQAG